MQQEPNPWPHHIATLADIPWQLTAVALARVLSVFFGSELSYIEGLDTLIAAPELTTDAEALLIICVPPGRTVALQKLPRLRKVGFRGPVLILRLGRCGGDTALRDALGSNLLEVPDPTHLRLPELLHLFSELAPLGDMEYHDLLGHLSAPQRWVEENLEPLLYRLEHDSRNEEDVDEFLHLLMWMLGETHLAGHRPIPDRPTKRLDEYIVECARRIVGYERGNNRSQWLLELRLAVRYWVEAVLESSEHMTFVQCQEVNDVRSRAR